MATLPKDNLLLTAGLAFAYFVAARLGAWAVVGPNETSAIWPAAGLALAAAMLLGVRALPGLAIGMFGANWFTFLGPLAGFDLATLAGALGLTLADLVQAGGAARLLADFPERLRAHPVQQTLRFAGTAAAASLVSSAASQAALWLLHRAAAGELLLGGATWWIGDATGMLVVAPGLLVLLHPRLRVDRLAIQAFPLVCLGLGVTLFSSFAVGIVDRDARIGRFQADASRLAMAIQNHVDLTGRDLETLQHHFHRAPVEVAEFRAVAAPLLARSPWQATFVWQPRVGRAERAALEGAAGGLDGISIRELRPDGGMVRADVRDEYFPILWTEPAAGRESLVGLDPASDPQYGAALSSARATGTMTATPPLSSAADSPDGRVVQVLYLPIGGLEDASVARHDASRVRGLVAATMDLAALLRISLGQMGISDQTLLLLDPDAVRSAALEWTDAGGVRVLEPAERAGALARFSGGVSRRQVLRVADRAWELRMRPAWADRMPRPTWLQAGVLASGLAFTALLTAFLVVRRRHDLMLQEARERLEEQVLERTHDLAVTNHRLLDEIAGHRHTENLLQDARRRAESANRAKSLFLANMSHEIRTPLNAVLGYTQLLIEDRRQSAEGRERLRIIYSAGQRLLGLINDVLDLAKIEAGGLQVHAEPVSLRRELAEIEALFAPRAQAKGLGLRAEVDLDGDAALVADRAKFGQIVLNLLGNALKFTDAGEIVLRAWRAGGDTFVEVEDTGPGMDQAELDAVFTPFRQGAAGFDKGGTGLGLALSRNIAHALGGELTITSRPGIGTRVRLRLPMPEAEGEAPPAPAYHGGRRLAAGSTCRALVVEDDPHSRDVLVTLLRDAGCEVESAVDGAAGLAACRASVREGARPFSIVFSDIRMPRMDGLQMMHQLRADPLTRGLPLVAVSASSLEHERRYYISEGFHDFVGKPYDFEAIYAMLALHANALLVDRAGDGPADEARAASEDGAAVRPGPDSHAAAVRARLVALADAAATGTVALARQALAQLAALGPNALAPGLLVQLEADLRLYDFGAIEARVRERLRDGAPAEPVQP
jgi:signal transduction histidine kinase/FixJ family two-component response regulator